MSSEKTTAIVLRVVDFSETSSVVTLMTRDFGKITALAKGARRKKSPFEAALDVLAICRVVFLHKKSQSLDLLTEAKLERRFRAASVDLERLYAAYYVVELLAALTDEDDPHVPLFDLAEDTIIRLDSGRGSPTAILLRFEMHALSILGHSPMLTHCVGCARPRNQPDRRVSFGLNEGGILCRSCRKGKTKVVGLSSDSWKTMVQFSQADDQEPTTIADGCQAETRSVMNQYLSHLLGYRPRLQKYITKIR
ncbi:MAG: DNA repair protein RecO [Planctomycetota bacterium]|nr:DNA repair protein RecO [Planctomycetota bacterium]